MTKRTQAASPAVTLTYVPQPYQHVPALNKDTGKLTKPGRYDHKLLADVPNAKTCWTEHKPNGLHKIHHGISHATADKLRRFFFPLERTPDEPVPTNPVDAIRKLDGVLPTESHPNWVRDADPNREAGSFPWKKRFKRFKTGHFNSAHFNATDVPEIKQACIEAVQSARMVCDCPTLKLMLNMDDVSVAIMLHRPGWGLGAHPDTWAPDDTGIVIMVTVVNKKKLSKGQVRKYRDFQFTCPPRGLYYIVETEHGSVVVFTREAYDTWFHESLRNPKQTDDHVSLTIRLRQQDGYFQSGWNVPDEIKKAIDRVAGVKETRSVGFAKMMQHHRLQRDQPWLEPAEKQIDRVSRPWVYEQEAKRLKTAH